MIDALNSFLQNAEKFIVSYRKVIGKIFLLLSLLVLPLIFYYPSIKETGEQTLNVLLFLLFLPIFSRVLGIKLAQAIMSLRKEIGILMGSLAFVHGAGYIFEYPTFIISEEFWWQEGMITYLAIGVISLSITILLTLTSNIYSIKLLGKHWKTLHRGVYLIAILTILHVVLLEWSKGELEIGKPILLGIYFIGKIFEWKGVTLKGKKQYPKGQKWLCIPCGYIYDPLVGDPDGGIQPGTEFTDIPNNWKCPVCGVNKSDFVLYEEGSEQAQSGGKIIEKNMLNTNTLELVIETNENWESEPGQFMTFNWKDSQGLFTRMYSIAKQEDQRYTFLIKLNELGRGAKLLRSYEIGTELSLGGVHGNFILKKNKHDKIFVASGTGLAPIYNMILHTLPQTKISLYFSVSTLDELFYVEQLRTIAGLDLHIHVTREASEGFEGGRIDVSTIPANSETEWYLCGNPRMIEESREKLLGRSFQNIYTEEFN